MVSSFGVLEWSWNKCWSCNDKGLSQSTTGWGSERLSSTSQSSHVESVSFSLSSTHSKFQLYFAEMVCLVTEDWNQSVQEVPKRSLLPQRAFPPTNLEFRWKYKYYFNNSISCFQFVIFMQSISAVGSSRSRVREYPCWSHSKKNLSMIGVVFVKLRVFVTHPRFWKITVPRMGKRFPKRMSYSYLVFMFSPNTSS